MNKAARLFFAYQVRQYLPGIIAAVIGGVAVLWFYLGSVVFMLYDERGASSHQQIGTVTSFIERSVTRGNPNPAALVSIRLGTRETSVNTHKVFGVGQKLQVEYNRSYAVGE